MRKVQQASALLLFAVVAGVAHADLPDFTLLAEKNGPSVVNVTAMQSDSASAASPGADDQDDNDQDGSDQQGMPDILKKFFGPGGPGAPGGAHPRIGGESLGSGFILSSDGYILTNNHVVSGAEKVVVRLSDHRELDAKVVGTDEKSDVALLKVNATGLPAVSIGDSSKLKPGQWVVAIGSPFGFDHTITHGIVSYVGRSSNARNEQYVPFIQTDVPINRGNSGGPLFNLDGQVVGINSQIYSNTGGYMGVSFSVPINLAMNTVEQLKTTGHVSRGMIGVAIQGVNRDAAQSLGLPQVSGALVTSVTPGSGAEKAGVQPRDVILAYNSQPIDQQSDLPMLVGNTKPGSTAQLKVFRDGQTITLPVTVGELTGDKSTLASLGGEHARQHSALGLTVQDITAEQRKQLGLKDQSGVVVTEVGGAAKRSLLQPGDVVLMVGRRPIKSAGEFRDSVKDIKAGDSVMLLVKRDDATQFVTIAVPKPKNG